MSYLESHYRFMNDLSPQGKKKVFRGYEGQFLKYISADKRQSILDIGCGSGLFLEWLESIGVGEARGIDVDSDQVEYALKRGLNVMLKESNDAVVDFLMKSSEKYDLIVMLDVLEHVSGRHEVGLLLKAVAHSLAPSGVVLMSVPNANSNFACRHRYIDATHYRSYTEYSISSELRSAGFADVYVYEQPNQYVSWRSYPKNLVRNAFRLMRRLEASVEYGMAGWRMPLSLNLIVEASCRGDV